jgi:Raf kinase inhibitor-like YbhB/YbcL family protein
MRTPGWLLVVTMLVAGCGGGETPSMRLPGAEGAMSLASAAFSGGETIPRRYTCDGEGVSPPLSWSGVPGRARELVLVVEDRDADRFVHWTVLGISAAQTAIAEGSVPADAVETDNSFGERGWGAPCPPRGDGPHRYVFALYATDARLGLSGQASADEVREQLAKHALARGMLTGVFGRGE